MSKKGSKKPAKVEEKALQLEGLLCDLLDDFQSYLKYKTQWKTEECTLNRSELRLFFQPRMLFTMLALADFHGSRQKWIAVARLYNKFDNNGSSEDNPESSSPLVRKEVCSSLAVYAQKENMSDILDLELYASPISFAEPWGVNTYSPIIHSTCQVDSLPEVSLKYRDEDPKRSGELISSPNSNAAFDQLIKLCRSQKADFLSIPIGRALSLLCRFKPVPPNAFDMATFRSYCLRHHLSITSAAWNELKAFMQSLAPATVPNQQRITLRETIENLLEHSKADGSINYRAARVDIGRYFLKSSEGRPHNFPRIPFLKFPFPSQDNFYRERLEVEFKATFEALVSDSATCRLVTQEELFEVYAKHSFDLEKTLEFASSQHPPIRVLSEVSKGATNPRWWEAFDEDAVITNRQNLREDSDKYRQSYESLQKKKLAIIHREDKEPEGIVEALLEVAGSERDDFLAKMSCRLAYPPIVSTYPHPKIIPEFNFEFRNPDRHGFEKFLSVLRTPLKSVSPNYSTNHDGTKRKRRF